MPRRGKRLAAGIGLLLVLCSAVSGLAGGEVRNRALERIIGREYSADQGTKIAQAFQATVRAGLEESAVLSLVKVCVEGGFDAPQLLRALSLVGQIAVRGLDVEVFLDKIREGVAKGAPAEKVLKAAERRALLLNSAKMLLDNLVLEGVPLDDAGELLPDVVAALESGRSGEEIRRIISAAVAADEGVGTIRRRLFH